MRKVEPNEENPVDNVVIGFSEFMNPLLMKLGITPNMVTFVGFILCLFTLEALWVGDIYKFGTLLLLTYYTDCQDGSLARTSNNCTWEGDLADHMRDTFMIFGVISIVLLKYQPTFLQTLPMIILLSLSVVNFGCQQKSYQDNEERPSTCQQDETLTVLVNGCPDSIGTSQTRFFGFGTFILATIGWVIYLSKN
jgi:hypothetical protein